jgi:hypothetical protein
MLSDRRLVGNWTAVPFGTGTRMARVFEHVTRPDGSSFDLCALCSNKAAPVRATVSVTAGDAILLTSTAHGDQVVVFATGRGGYLNLEVTYQ